MIYHPDFNSQRKPAIRHQAVRRSETIRRFWGRHWPRHPAGAWACVLRSMRGLIDMVRETHTPRPWLFGSLASLATLLVAVVVVPVSAAVMNPPPVVGRIHLSLPIPAPPPLAAEPGALAAEDPFDLDGDRWQAITIRSKQTLGDVFGGLGLSPTLLHQVVQHSAETRSLTRIFPGQELHFWLEDGRFRGMAFDADEARRVVLLQAEEGFEQRILARDIERRTQYASARIEGSLFAAGQDAGLSDALIMRMAQIFNYDIDFALDLRAGDSFSVIYEEILRDGEKLRDGDIVAASFVNGGKRYEVYRFVDEHGRVDYYGRDGRSRARAFIRTPVEFTRISSRFSLARRHPVLGTMRAHRGVDYAAPTGTPVKATGDGKVLFRGWKSGYGNVIEIQHGQRYVTVYAHLSSFARGLERGSRVRQGQVIGAVGMTGLATGPHLHYEFRVDGSHRDPLSVELPTADPLRGAQLARFRGATESWVAQLEVMDRTLLAEAPAVPPAVTGTVVEAPPASAPKRRLGGGFWSRASRSAEGVVDAR